MSWREWWLLTTAFGLIGAIAGAGGAAVAGCGDWRVSAAAIFGAVVVVAGLALTAKALEDADD